MPAVATAGGLPTRLGKYEIMTPLAAGGMARIYIARTTGIGSFERHVVLKLITPERANDTTAVQMFLDEARLAASLNHQNVAQVFEVGEDAGIHYLAMEYVHGQDLRALLAKAGSQGTRVPLELALTVVAGAAAGLHHAHERRDPQGVSLGIVHRDVSPSNIMIGYDGAVKLLDFGIAKATARSVETQSGIIKGKFAYMAPEQCRGREVDRRSDVFSLGIILYEISTQHRCFRADSDFDTMHRIVTGDVVRPTRLLQGYPQALEAIVMKALAVDANQRYQSSHQLLEAIESFAVSARMSLSTMSLGRFMRDMFGDQPEPWLNQRGSGPVVVPKESTISNTNGEASESSVHRAPTNLPNLPEHHQQMQAASTMLDLPRPHGEEQELDEPNPAEWNAKSYPPVQPSYASTQTLPPDALAAQMAGRPSPMPPQHVSNHTPMSGMQPLQSHSQQGTPQPMPVAVPMGTQPMPPVSAFNATPGSGSGPSHSAIARYPNVNDLSYPRYEAPPGEPELQLKPNRRPLFIGLGIIVVGAAVILAMWIGKSGSKVPEPSPSPSESPLPSEHANVPLTIDAADAVSTSPSPSPTTSPSPSPTPEASPSPADTSISIKIQSKPEGADVLLNGKVIGTTPLNTKIEKTDAQSTLVVHKGGYVDESVTIDQKEDFETEVTLKKFDEGSAQTNPETPNGSGAKNPKNPKNPKNNPKDPKNGGGKTPKEPKASPLPSPSPSPTPKPSSSPIPPKPACQQPGQVDPFDPRPQCKT